MLQEDEIRDIPGKSPRQVTAELTDLMARLLHYQDSGEPDWSGMSYDGMRAEWQQLPPGILQRYRNDPKFHAQVTRAVADVLRIIR